MSVKEILAGRDRVQTEAFEAFRGAYPFWADFCAPAKGWEKGSVPVLFLQTPGASAPRRSTVVAAISALRLQSTGSSNSA